MRSLVLSLLLASSTQASVLKQKFVNGLQEGEPLNIDISINSGEYTKDQKMAQDQMKNTQGTGKKWVELKTCGPNTTNEIILLDDLSNATIATCKYSTPLYYGAVQKKWVELKTCGADTSKEIVLLDDLSNATIATCKYSSPLYYGTAQKMKKWVELETCGSDTSNEVVLRDDLSNATTATCKRSQPMTGMYAQTNGKWVELPTCDMDNLSGKEVVLKDNLSNATTATCKNDKPLDGYNKTKVSDQQVPTQVAQVHNKWIELEDCDGKQGEIALLDDLTNATSATCKKNPATHKRAYEAEDTNKQMTPSPPPPSTTPNA